MKRSGSAPILPAANDLTVPIHPSKDDPRSLLLERVLASSPFKGSLRQREILIYIVECALRDTPEAATEQQIGVHVFHRAPGYNSSEDSIVRTHARLLRQKLAEYFAGEGVAEPTILEVPKGHYFPIFRARAAVEPEPAKVPAIVPPIAQEVAAVPATGFRVGRPAWILLGTLLLIGLAGAGVLLARGVHGASASSVDAFWAPFYAGEPPLVIYSNTHFVGDSKTGLRYAPPGTESVAEPVVDHYTGIGEVAAVYELTRMFDTHHASFLLKRSLLVTWDEAKLRNLAFIGSPAENPSLHALPALADFTMMTGPGSAGFVNNHPRAGEEAVYQRPEHPLTKDYAVVAVTPGVESGKRTVIFSGLTTLGTQGAVEYAVHKDTVTELMKLVASPSGEVRPFEALIEVPIEGGVPLPGRLVAIRVH